MKHHNGEYQAPIPNIPGWMSGDELEWLYQQAKKHRVIVEVGSAFGRSSHALLTGNYESFGGDGRVYCVDPWPLKDEATKRFDLSGKDLRRKMWFLHNVAHFPNLSVVELPSQQAVKAFDTVPVDMVFLDGGTDQVEKDLAYWGTMSYALLAVHDYDNDKYPNVVKAVDEFQRGIVIPSRMTRQEVVANTSIWSFRWSL